MFAQFDQSRNIQYRGSHDFIGVVWFQKEKESIWEGGQMTKPIVKLLVWMSYSALFSVIYFFGGGGRDMF